MMKTNSLHGGDIEFHHWQHLEIFCYKYGNIFVSKNFGVCYSEIHCDKILEKIHLIILTTYFKNF